MKKFSRTALIVTTLVTCMTGAQTASAGLGKWFEKEVVGTFTGEHQVRLKPSVKFTHQGNSLYVDKNNLRANIGNIRIKTGNLQERAIQAGCVYHTGNLAACGVTNVLRLR